MHCGTRCASRDERGCRVKRNAIVIHVDISPRRVAAMVAAVVVNAGLLLACFAPPANRFDTRPDRSTHVRGMELRFVTNERPLPPLQSSGKVARPRKSSARRRATDVVSSLPSEQPVRRDAPLSPGVSPTLVIESPPSTATDGGFARRLDEARHAAAPPALPGSDRRIAPALNLTDPTRQGVGSMVRKAQRLFGVTSNHCTDVDAWRRLSPEQLAGAHMTEREVERINQTYECNRPMGLAW